MIRFLENHSLKAHNTFGVEAKARSFFEFTELEDLQLFFQSEKNWLNEKLIVIGEGSNILFLTDFDGLVIHSKVPGMGAVNEDRQHEWIEVGAGEVWDEFVEFAVGYQLGGIENLSLIPGTVGASPVQNIGAYGQEVCNVIEKVKGFDLELQLPVEFTASECQFAYRDSIFKNHLKNKVIITSVVYKLDKFPEFSLHYGGLDEHVRNMGDINLRNIRKSVIDIRSAKLPDVSDLGSAGSFFKNPVVETAFAEKLQACCENMPVYPAPNGKSKLPAGWLIEQAGWKGFREGDAGVHENQALVLVNYGDATGQQIFDLSEKIKQSVFEKFGVELQREVNCI